MYCWPLTDTSSRVTGATAPSGCGGTVQRRVSSSTSCAVTTVASASVSKRQSRLVPLAKPLPFTSTNVPPSAGPPTGVMPRSSVAGYASNGVGAQPAGSGWPLSVTQSGASPDGICGVTHCSSVELKNETAALTPPTAHESSGVSRKLKPLTTSAVPPPVGPEGGTSAATAAVG